MSSVKAKLIAFFMLSNIGLDTLLNLNNIKSNSRNSDLTKSFYSVMNNQSVRKME